MISYEQLVAALREWRIQQGLAVGPADFAGTEAASAPAPPPAHPPTAGTWQPPRGGARAVSAATPPPVRLAPAAAGGTREDRRPSSLRELAMSSDNELGETTVVSGELEAEELVIQYDRHYERPGDHEETPTAVSDRVAAARQQVLAEVAVDAGPMGSPIAGRADTGSLSFEEYSAGEEATFAQDGPKDDPGALLVDHDDFDIDDDDVILERVEAEDSGPAESDES